MPYREGQFDAGGTGAEDGQLEASAGAEHAFDQLRPRGDEALDRSDQQRVLGTARQVTCRRDGTGVDREQVKGQFGAVVATKRVAGWIQGDRSGCWRGSSASMRGDAAEPEGR